MSAQNHLNAANAMYQIKDIMSLSQRQAMREGCRGEEKEFFQDKLIELANTFRTMPKTYEQDGMGNNAVVYLHYFMGNADWFIIEKDMEDEQHQAFGYCDLGMGFPELGYVSLLELAEIGAEIDLHWTPKTLGEVKKERADI